MSDKPYPSRPDPSLTESTSIVIPRKVAHWVPTTAEVLAGISLGDLLDSVWHPWKYPDRPSWPEFVLLPRLERARVAVATLRERIDLAVAALRGEWPDDDWDDQ